LEWLINYRKLWMCPCKWDTKITYAHKHAHMICTEIQCAHEHYIRKSSILWRECSWVSVTGFSVVYTSCRSWASLILVHVWACLWVYLIVVSHEHAHIDIQYMYQNPVCSWAPSYIYRNTVSAWEYPYENVTGFWYIYEHVHEIPKGGMRTLIYVHCTKIQYAHGHHPIYQMMQYPYELACSWVCYSILVHIMQRAHVHTGFLYVYERAYLSIPSFVPHQYGHTCTKFQYAYGHPQRGTLVWSKIQYPHKNACPSVCYWILVHAYMTVLMRYQNKVCS
jgi:hypothetical protein